MKIIGFMPIHYGIEYLKVSLESLATVCDKVYVSYSKKPSHGHEARVGNKVMQPPDSRDQIVQIASDTLGSKLIWEEFDRFPYEGAHRATILRHCEPYDMVVTCDSDEVFDRDTLPAGIKMAWDGPHKLWGTCNYVNFWKSFNHIVRDGFSPIRIHNLRREGGTGHGLPTKIYHFGTCQKNSVMDYKYLCHGHKAEIRPNWLQEVYYPWSPSNRIPNLHPVAHGIWHAEDFDKTSLPDYIKTHANFNKEVVS